MHIDLEWFKLMGADGLNPLLPVETARFGSATPFFLSDLGKKNCFVDWFVWMMILQKLSFLDEWLINEGDTTTSLSISLEVKQFRALRPTRSLAYLSLARASSSKEGENNATTPRCWYDVEGSYTEQEKGDVENLSGIPSLWFWPLPTSQKKGTRGTKAAWGFDFACQVAKFIIIGVGSSSTTLMGRGERNIHCSEEEEMLSYTPHGDNPFSSLGWMGKY
jgi:hypothetical protein